MGSFCPVVVQSTSVFLKDVFNTAHLKTCSDVVGWTCWGSAKPVSADPNSGAGRERMEQLHHC